MLGKKLSMAIVVIMVITVALGATACGSKGSSSDQGGSAGKAVTLKLGHIMAPTDPLAKGAEKFAELVNQKTNGSVQIELFPSSQLGSAPDEIDGVRVGSQDIFVDAISWYQDMDGLHDLRAIAMPTAFRSYDHLLKWLGGEDGQKLFKAMEDTYGLKVISYDWYRPPRQLLSKKPVQNPADLKGLKVRVPEQQLWVDAWKAAGCTPTAIAWSEIYTSLQQGLVEAVEAPISLLYSSKFQEQAKNLTLTNHTFNSVGLVMNAEKFNSLSADQQKALLEAAEEAGQYQADLYKESEQKNLEDMKAAGVKIYDLSDAQRQAMFKPTEDFAKQAEAKGEWSQGLWDRIQALAK